MIFSNYLLLFNYLINYSFFLIIHFYFTNYKVIVYTNYFI